MRIVVAPLVLAAGCNLVFGLDEPSGDGDGGGTGSAIDAAPRDATDGSPVVDAPLGAWGPAHLVFMPNTTDELSPALSPDSMELYLTHRAAGGDYGIYRSTLVGSAWTAFALVPELFSVGNDSSPRLSMDGKTIFFTSDRPGGQGGADVWYATRASVPDSWGQVINAGPINTPFDDRALASCDEPNHYVLASDRAGTGDLDLYEITGAGAALIAIASTTAHETSPFVTPDCLTLYYTSVVQGSYDLYVAHRDAIDQPFVDATRIDELSSTESDELDPWVSRDQRRMLFAGGDPGSRELLESLR